MTGHTAEKDALDFVKAFVDLYNEIDGVTDEMSTRDYRLTQEFWPLHEAAKDYLARIAPPAAVPCTCGESMVPPFPNDTGHHSTTECIDEATGRVIPPGNGDSEAVQ